MSGAATHDAKRRRTSARVIAVVNTALLAAIALMINYLAFRHYERWDWTEESIFTLSERSERVLAELSQPVEIWVLVGEAEPEHAEIRNLLERYAAESARITVRYVDPFRDPGAYADVVRRFDLRVGQRAVRGSDELVPTADVAVVVASGARHWEIGREDLVRHEFDDDDDGRVTLNVETERAITGAILEVTEGRPTKVCFTTGHGEIGLDEGLAELRAELRRENLEHETLSTRGLDAIPATCDAVIVMGPELAFVEQEAELLRDYVRGGGNLLVALDPVPDRDRRRVLATGLERVLRDFGVRVGDDIVVEPSPAALPAGQGHPVVLYLVGDFGQHAITEPFRRGGLPLAIAEARSVQPIGESAHVLLRTSPQSYAERDLSSFAQGEIGEPGADDLAGPVPLGVATEVEVTGREENDERKRTGGRVVVLGDASMFTSQLLAAPSVMNLPFAGAVIGWLTEREAMISIPPRSIEQPAMPSEVDVGNLFFRVVVLIPLAFVFLGIAVFWNRRS